MFTLKRRTLSSIINEQQPDLRIKHKMTVLKKHLHLLLKLIILYNKKKITALMALSAGGSRNYPLLSHIKDLCIEVE